MTPNTCSPLSTEELADIKVLLNKQIDSLSKLISKEDDAFLLEQYNEYKTRLVNALKTTSRCFDKK